MNSQKSVESSNTFFILFIKIYNDIMLKGGVKMDVMKHYIGTRAFYKRASLLAIPLAIQQLVSSCMGIIDSLMVSWIHQVTAVGTAVQIETLCSAVAWGAIAGTGIFSAQFYGAKDHDNLKRTFGLSVILGLGIGLIWLLIAALFGRKIIAFYIQDPNVIANSHQYLMIAMFSYIPLSLGFSFSYIYRSIQKTKVPLIIGIAAMGINIFVNYVLIFGYFGFPELGIQGAAIGTLIAQSFVLIVNIVYAYATKQEFIGTFHEMFSLDYHFVRPIMRKIQPLIWNELMFGFGSTLFVKAFGALGTSSMDAYYVGAKLSDVFNALVTGISNATAVMLGVALGSGDVEKAREEGNYFVGMAAILAVMSIVFIFGCSHQLVSIFQLEDSYVVGQAIAIVKVFSLKIALRMFIVIVLSSLRAGGDSKILAILDSGFMWLIGIPLAFISVHLFHIQSIALVFFICQLEQVIRVYFGMKRYNQGNWAINLTTLISK